MPEIEPATSCARLVSSPLDHTVLMTSIVMATLDFLFADAAESETEVDHMKPSNPHLDREINMSGLFTFHTDACHFALDREIDMVCHHSPH